MTDSSIATWTQDATQSFSSVAMVDTHCISCNTKSHQRGFASIAAALRPLDQIINSLGRHLMDRGFAKNPSALVERIFLPGLDALASLVFVSLVLRGMFAPPPVFVGAFTIFAYSTIGARVFTFVEVGLRQPTSDTGFGLHAIQFSRFWPNDLIARPDVPPAGPAIRRR